MVVNHEQTFIVFVDLLVCYFRSGRRARLRQASVQIAAPQPAIVANPVQGDPERGAFAFLTPVREDQCFPEALTCGNTNGDSHHENLRYLKQGPDALIRFPKVGRLVGR
jgi:hypothetical protein